MTLDGRKIHVRGESWMDHEFSSAPLEPGVVGWDWFGVQLSDGSELMLFLLRMRDGTINAASSGTFVNSSGKAVHLPVESLSVAVQDHWRSPRSGAVYPSGWKVRGPPMRGSTSPSPRISRTRRWRRPESTGVTYWEGSVSATGTGANGAPVTGNGYVELTRLRRLDGGASEVKSGECGLPGDGVVLQRIRLRPWCGGTLVRRQRSQSSPYARTNAFPVAVRQAADKHGMGGGRQGSEKATENRWDSQTGLSPILQHVIRWTNGDVLTRDKADDNVRARGMIGRRGNHEGGSAFQTGHTGKINCHHISRIKQVPAPRGRGQQRTSVKWPSDRFGPVRSRYH